MTDVDKDLDGGSGEGSSEMAAVQELLDECGVEEYDPRVLGMLMDAQFAITTKLLEMSSGIARHSEKSLIEAEDVQMATDMLGILKNIAPNREKMLQLAQDKNAQPLPAIRHNYGLKLPNDRFCQLQQNVEFKTADYALTNPHVQNTAPLIEQRVDMLRPDQVQNILKRRAPDDDFDS